MEAHKSSVATCKVCGDEASGFHYGVDSCEGCKGFFRRCITQGMNHKCSNEEKCEITPFSRNSCQYCRLKKCFAVGMSREASRLGRRPKRLKGDHLGEHSAVRNHSQPIAPYPPMPAAFGQLNLAEIQIQQILKSKNGNKMPEFLQNYIISNTPVDTKHGGAASNTDISMPSNSSQASESGYSSLGSETPCSSKSQSPSTAQLPYSVTNSIAHINPMAIQQSIKLEKDQHQACAASKNQAVNSNDVNLNNTGGVVPSVMGNETKVDIVDRLLDYLKQPISAERMVLINQVTKTVFDAHMETCPFTVEKVRQCRMELAQKAKDGTGLTPEMMKKMNMDPSKLWETFVGHMVPTIKMIVHFCKMIPGFCELIEDDQIRLIKQGSFEVVLTRFLRLVDHMANTMIDPGMQVMMPRHVVHMLPIGSLFDGFFDLASVLNPLNLSDCEMALFTCVTIMSPDRIGLSNTKAVQKLQAVFFQGFHSQLRKRLTNAQLDECLKSIATFLPMLRKVNEEHSKALNNMKMAQQGANLPELHQEVYDGEHK